MDGAVELIDVVDQLFPQIDLGDVRRNRRFRQVVEAVAARPGASLPQVFPDPSQYHRCLQLLHSPACTHEAVLSAHQVAVLQHLETLTTPVLLLHDATLLDFSGHTSMAEDLGPIGNGGGRGWIAQQTLAVDPATRVVYGLVAQILHAPTRVAADESVRAKRDRPSRESRLWVRALDEIGPTPATAAWLHVADRGADIFEFLSELTRRGHRFVVRSAHNRALGDGPTDAKSTQLLHDRLRTLPAVTTWAFPIPARAGRPARTAALSAVAERVTLRPPHVRRGAYAKSSVTATAIRVWEPSPPAGTEPVEWLLLTSDETPTGAAVQTVVQWYSCRMQIEEFHKVQKSGVGVERAQLQSGNAMATLVALLSVVAVGLMNVRLAARDPKYAKQPAENFVPALWIEVLRNVTATPRSRKWTVADFWVQLARLGGYLKNPIKHPPGWITLWRGWTTLHQFIHYHLSITKIQ